MEKFIKYFTKKEIEKRKYKKIYSEIEELKLESDEKLKIIKIDLETKYNYRNNLFKVLFSSLILTLIFPIITNLSQIIYNFFIKYNELISHKNSDNIIIGTYIISTILFIIIISLVTSILIVINKQRKIEKTLKIIDLILIKRRYENNRTC